MQDPTLLGMAKYTCLKVKEMQFKVHMFDNKINQHKSCVIVCFD